MELKGDFTHLDLPALISKAAVQYRSCTLLLKVGNRSVRIYFDQGKAAFISSSDPDERFGEYLMYTDKITMTQYLTASKRVTGEGKKLGAVLVEEGFLSYEEQLHSLSSYILDLGASVFREKRGRYAFLKPENPSNLPVEMFIDHRRLIYEGVRRHRQLTTVRAVIPSPEVVPDFTDSEEAVFRVLELSVEEQSILEWISGANPVSAICSYSSLPEFETLQVLAGLAHAGLIRFGVSSGRRASEREVEFQVEDLVRRYNESFQVIYSFLQDQESGAFDAVQDAAFRQLSELERATLQDVDLNNYGFIDFDILYRNLHPLPVDERLPRGENVLKALLKALIVETGRVLGESAMSDLKEALPHGET